MELAGIARATESSHTGHELEPDGLRTIGHPGLLDLALVEELDRLFKSFLKLSPIGQLDLGENERGLSNLRRLSLLGLLESRRHECLASRCPADLSSHVPGGRQPAVFPRLPRLPGIGRVAASRTAPAGDVGVPGNYRVVV